jgi:signal transduction histidine kinase
MTWPGRRVSRTAWAIVALAFAAAAVVVVTGRHLERTADERDAASASAGAVTAVADGVRAAISAVAPSSPGDVGVSASAAISKGVSESVLTQARDSGQPVLDDTVSAIVVARYHGDGVPPNAQDRRDQVTGYRVVPLDLGSTLSPLVPSGGGISVSGPDRRIQSIPAAGPGSAASFTTSLGPDLPAGWTVTVWVAPSRTPLIAWLLAAVLLVSGLVAAAWVAIRQGEARQHRDQLRGLQQSSATVAAVATLAQHSLDLGEVLPAVATELYDVFDLQGLSLSTPTPHGERPLFVLGLDPDPTEPPAARDEVAPGGTVALVLSRGGRIAATLRVKAGRRLHAVDVQTLTAAADVLSSALANAEVFSQQAELIRRMRAVDELKTVFLATASHELRTPVVALAGYANLLYSSWDSLAPDAARSHAERIDRIAQRLNILVEDILDFSRLQSGRGPAADDAVLDLGEAVGLVLQEQSDIAPNHDLRYHPGSDLPVSGSRQAIERVVTNLVGNAAKYSDAGSVILVSTRRVDGHAELVVEDEGPGIPADQREQVFSPFYRGSGDEVVRTRGAGLGLAIVAEFAATMSGRARVEDAASGGASFVVSYPIVAEDRAIETGGIHVQA